MLQTISAFSGFSVDDQAAALGFYRDTLGLDAKDSGMGLELKVNDNAVFIYEKEDHQPATFTVFNFVVTDINTAVDELVEKGITFERYDNMPGAQDDRGVMRGKDTNDGPNIAWFKDPAGNVLALIED